MRGLIRSLGRWSEVGTPQTPTHAQVPESTHTRTHAHTHTHTHTHTHHTDTSHRHTHHAVTHTSYRHTQTHTHHTWPGYLQTRAIQRWSLVTCNSVKRDLIKCQKRPIKLSKET
jgi:hypothetical protein